MSSFILGGLPNTEPTTGTGLANANYVDAQMAKGPDDGLLCYYKLDESADPRVDSTGLVGNLFQYGNVTAITGKVGAKAIRCEGTQSFLSKAVTTEINCPGSMTLQAWVKPNVIVSGEHFGVGGLLGGGVAFYEAIVRSTGGNLRFRFRVSTSGTDWTNNYDHTTNLTLGTWYLLTAVYDQPNAKVTLYVNTTAVSTASGITAIATTTDPKDIGVGNYTGTGSEGDVDEFAIWKRPLSLAEISAIYRNANGSSYGQVGDVSPQSTVPFGFETSGVTVGNTTTETSLIGSLNYGTNIVPANGLPLYGTLGLRLVVLLTTTAVPGTVTIRVKTAGGTIVTAAFTPPANLSAVVIAFVDNQVMCEAAGTNGTWRGTWVESVTPNFYTGTLEVDTTAAQTLDLTWQWQTADAGNTVYVTSLLWRKS